jgi:hypothetical protein
LACEFLRTEKDMMHGKHEEEEEEMEIEMY